jgi:hypothetical protein
LHTRHPWHAIALRRPHATVHGTVCSLLLLHLLLHLLLLLLLLILLVLPHQRLLLLHCPGLMCRLLLLLLLWQAIAWLLHARNSIRHLLLVRHAGLLWQHCCRLCVCEVGEQVLHMEK